MRALEWLEPRRLLSGGSLAQSDFGSLALSYPVAGDDYYSTPADTTLNVSAPGLLANDYDPDGHRIEVLFLYWNLDLDHGTLYLDPWRNDGSFDYAPYAGHNGQDTFTYMCIDEGGYSVEATVTIDVGVFNHAPYVADPIDDVTVDQGAPNTVIDLDTVFDDVDIPPDDLTYSVSLSPPIHPIVDQVSQSSYEDIHGNLLYTHLGDDRGIGSVQHDQARDNIESYFLSLGLETSLDVIDEIVDVFGNTYHFDPPLVNVVGVKRGVTHPEEAYLVGAHYDSVSNPGADDNASGVAGVMEAARVLSGQSFDSTLVFVAFDGEEDGLFGSMHYAEFHYSDHNIPGFTSDLLGMVSLDMIAYNHADVDQDVVSIFDVDNIGHIKFDLVSAFNEYGGGLTGRDDGTIDLSDHAYFDIYGFDAALVIESGVYSNPHYHQPTDAVETPDYIDYAYATKITRATTGYLAHSAWPMGAVDVLAAGVTDNQLALDYDPSEFGSALVTVRATDSEGLFVEDFFSVTVEDSDTAGITIHPTSGLTTTEAGGTAEFTIVLDTQPTANVTIDLSSSDPGEGTLPASVTFTSADWSTAQTVTITGQDDHLDDGDVAYTVVTHPASSSDSDYNDRNAANVAVTNLDGGFIDMSWNLFGGGISGPQPTDDLVFIHHSCGRNWLDNSLHDALVSKDYIDERNDIYYGSVLAPDPGRPASLAPTPGDRTNMNHWIRWFNDYLGEVTTYDSDDGVNKIVMFKSCYPISNVTSDGTEPGDPFASTQSLVNYKAVYRHPDGPGNTYSDGGYTYLSLEDVFAQNSDTLFIAVTAPPRHYAPSDATSDAEGHRARLFNNWLKNDWLDSYTAQNPGLNNVAVFDWFDVLAYPDDDPLHPNRLMSQYGGESGDSHPNSQANSDTTDVFAIGDVGGITVEPLSGLETSEAGGQTSFTIVLNSQPTGNVSIGLSSSNTTEGQVSPTSVTFTSGDWSTAQTVTVTGQNDHLDDGDVTYTILTAPASSSDSNYNNLDADDVSVTNIDNDTAGVAIFETGGDTEVVEGGATDTYHVVLTSQPTHDVHVLLDPDAQVGVDPAGPLVFTLANWNSPQTVTVSAVDDDLVEGIHTGTIVHSTLSTDPLYNVIGVDSVTAHIGDNDAAGVQIMETGGDTELLEDGATDTYTVVLISRPTHDVHVFLDPDIQVHMDPAGPLVFTPANWDSAQTVTVSAVDDDVVEGVHTGTILHSTLSDDPLYDGIGVDGVTAVIGDNDTASVVVMETGGDTEVGESGATDTYTIVLTSEPTHDVYVSLGPDSQVNVDPAGPLLFTPANWDSARTVTVSAVDDDLVEGVHTGTIAHSTLSDDPLYDGIGVDGVTAVIGDNDTASVQIVETGGDTEVGEGGATDTYRVVLTSQPTQDVLVLLDPDAQVGVDPAGPLVFTPANWDSAQTVTVSAVEDDVAEGLHTGTIVHTTSSRAPLYNGISVDSVTAMIGDNDTAGVVLLQTGGSTELLEGGTTDTYHVVLTSQPTHDVHVLLNPDSQVNVDPAGPLVFTPANWDSAQTVTVSAVDDGVSEGLHTGTIVHTTSSTDPRYNAIIVDGVTANIRDNSNSPPSIGSLSNDPDPVERGDSLSLTANDVVDPDGDVASVTFWRDSNGDQALDGLDEELGADGNPSDGWGLLVSTASFPLGEVTYFARATDSGGRLSNVASAAGVVQGSVELYGTDLADTITFTTGANHVVTINDDEYVYDPAEVSVISIYALDGRDSITITGSAGDETAELRVGSVDVVGTTYRVHAESVATIIVRAGGGVGNQAYLYDSDAAQDTLVATPEYGRLYGDGFDNRVEGFQEVTALAAGTGPLGTAQVHTDLALLHDSVEADVLEATPEYGKLKFGGNEDHFVQAVGFRYLHVYGTPGGGDQAVLQGDPSGQDTFEAWPDNAKLSGDGYFLRAKSFADVRADGTPGGNDLALLHDDPNSIDTFEGGPDQAELSGDAFFLQANSFRYVHAYATAGGNDVATFQDDPDRFDRLRAWPGEAKLWGAEFFLRAKSFRYLYANSTPGVGDQALLYDSITDDAFTAWPDRAVISGDTFFTQANAFRWVHAYSTEGNDVATFYGSDGRDVFVGTERFGKLRGTSFYNRAVSFGQLHVYGGAGRDVAVLYDAVLEAGVTQPVDMTQVAWLYELERIRQRSDSGETITDAVDEIFTAYWE